MEEYEILTKYFGKVARLHVHALDHAVDLCVCIGHLLGQSVASLSIEFLVADAECPEVVAGLRAVLVEQLYHDLLWLLHTGDLQRHLNVASAGRVVDCSSVGITSKLPVNEYGGLVGVAELLEGPLEKLLGAAHVRCSIDEDNRAALMLVESALLEILQILQVLVPLRGEELQHVTLHASWVLGLQLLDACKASMKGLIADYSCQRYVVTSGLHFEIQFCF